MTPRKYLAHLPWRYATSTLHSGFGRALAYFVPIATLIARVVLCHAMFGFSAKAAGPNGEAKAEMTVGIGRTYRGPVLS
jgi:hypothetical protein